MLNTKTIGSKITEARKKVNISQAQLAEKLFISSQAVGKWERGESMPDIITFNRLAEILSVDLNYFSDGMESVSVESTHKTTIESEKTNSTNEKTEKKLNWNMSGGNWIDADFSGLKNLHEKFSSSNMQKCKFIGSELSGLLLKNNNVENCDFSNSNMSKSKFQGSNLSKNIYKNCLLQESEFSSCNMGECDFSDANFTGATFKSGAFSKNKIENTIWNQTTFIGMGIDEMIFEGNFSDCYFENCGFHRVTFQNATILNSFFKNNKNLKRVKFINCKVDPITYSFLKSGGSDMSGITGINS